MNKVTLGAISGTIFGLLDGLSAFLVPGAESMLTEIITGSTIKGFVGGVIAGIIAKRSSSVLNTTLLSGVVAGILSVLAAIPSGAYVEIVAPGIAVGLLTGFVTHKWGK